MAVSGDFRVSAALGPYTKNCIRSSKHPRPPNKRLKFLRDAVLDYLLTSYLYSVYPKLRPRQFTDLRSASVDNKTFAAISVRQSLHKHIICHSPSLHESITLKEHALETSCNAFLGKEKNLQDKVEELEAGLEELDQSTSRLCKHLSKEVATEDLSVNYGTADEQVKSTNSLSDEEMKACVLKSLR